MTLTENEKQFINFAIEQTGQTKLIPVDSEHYSVLKLLENQDFNEIKKIYLTASGGPFLNYKPSKLKKGSKAWKRRKSFCARSKGWKSERGLAARRKWNC